MDTYGLKLFLHLAGTLHFHKTSQACYLSPSGLTRAIQRLEEEAGARLFERDNRRVVLTKDGEVLKRYARQILEGWEDFLQSVAARKGILQGELRIYCSVTASYSLLRPILDKFRSAFPEVHIRLQTGAAASAINHVLGDEADLAIIALPESLPPGLLFREQSVIPLVFIAPVGNRAIIERLSPWPACLEKIPLILPEHGLARQRIDNWLAQEKIAPMVYAEVEGNEAIIAMVGLGCGVGIVPELVLRESSLAGEIRLIKALPELDAYHVGFCLKEKRLSAPVVTAFWELVQEGGC